MKRFEYKTEIFELVGVCGPKLYINEERLNELGNEGWELVQVFQVPWGGNLQCYFFKREIEPVYRALPLGPGKP